MVSRKKNLCPKIFCEVCGENNKAVLHRHHILPRTDVNCTNHHMNLCVVCANCHAKIHTGELEIIGVFPGTRPPTGRILVYKLGGICNVPEMENVMPYRPKPQSMKYYAPNATPKTR